MKHNMLAGLAIAAGLALSAPMAQAANCSVYQSGASSTFLNTTNVKLNGSDSDDCAGHYDTGSADLNTVATFANGIPLFGFNDWSGAAKRDSSTSSTATISGLKFELVNVVGIGATSGSFTLQVTDTNGAAYANLDATMDLSIMLSRGANVNDFYFFNDETISISNNGSFTVGFTNNPGGPNPQPQLQNLSHILVLVRDIRSNVPCDPTDPRCLPNETPEPGSIALAGLALLALGRTALRRRRG